jgi:hypothetical protein
MSDLTVPRSLEVAGSVLWGAFGAVKELLGVQNEELLRQRQQQQQQQQQQQRQLPSVSDTIRLDHHAAASLCLRVSAAAAGFGPSFH